MANYVSNNAGYEIDNMIDSYLSFRKTIKVFAPEGSTIIVTYSSSGIIRNVPGFKYSNYTLFFPENYGSYVVSCRYNGSNSEEILDIDTIKIYEVNFISPGPEPEVGYVTFSSDAVFSLGLNSGAVPGYSDTYYSKGWDGDLEYSTDKVTWSSWTNTSSSIQSIQQVYGKYEIYLRGSDNTAFCKYITDPGEWYITNFVLTASQGKVINCFGNIESLLDYQDVLSGISPNKTDYTFWMLFKGCTSLASTPSLPATTLTNNCYQSMFSGCTSLTSASSLPATTLVYACYWLMFEGCTSLITPPALPATTLAGSCYSQMFMGCTSLTTAPELPVTDLSNYSSCYLSMFEGCTSLSTAPALPATTLGSSCYAGMFKGCTSLITAPLLLATTLAQGCYMQMFMNCTSLTTAPAIRGGALPENCCASMFEGCTSIATMPISFGVGSAGRRCCSRMFYGCISLAGTLPLLTADVLPLQCYYQMFYDCSSIKLSSTQTGGYTEPYRIPTTLTGTTTGTEVVEDMFTGTGGTFTGTPYLNTTYYQDIS